MRMLGDRPWGEKNTYDELVAGTGGDLEDTSGRFKALLTVQCLIFINIAKITLGCLLFRFHALLTYRGRIFRRLSWDWL